MPWLRKYCAADNFAGMASPFCNLRLLAGGLFKLGSRRSILAPSKIEAPKAHFTANPIQLKLGDPQVAAPLIVTNSAPRIHILAIAMYSHLWMPQRG
jgi:hypothetical protein